MIENAQNQPSTNTVSVLFPSDRIISIFKHAAEPFKQFSNLG